jgi:hypothetical protein
LKTKGPNCTIFPPLKEKLKNPFEGNLNLKVLKPFEGYWKVL